MPSRKAGVEKDVSGASNLPLVGRPKKVDAANGFYVKSVASHFVLWSSFTHMFETTVCLYRRSHSVQMFDFSKCVTINVGVVGVHQSRIHPVAAV